MKVVTWETAGGWVRLTRRSKQLTLKAVADRLGVSVPYLADIERGERTFPQDMAGPICEAMGCDFQDSRRLHAMAAVEQGCLKIDCTAMALWDIISLLDRT